MTNHVLANAVDHLAELGRQGNFVAVDQLAMQLTPALVAQPRMALKLARLRMTQGYMLRAVSVLDAADRSHASLGERLLLDIETEFLRVFLTFDIGSAMAGCERLLSCEAGSIDAGDAADATRAAARLAQMACVYRELSREVAEIWREKLLGAASALKASGRLDEAFDALLNYADWPHQQDDVRLHHLAAVADEARSLGLPARAATAHLGRANALINAGAPSTVIETEILQAERDFEAGRHVTGALEVARVREALKVKDQAADLAALESLASAFQAASLPRQTLSVLIDLSQAAHERGRLGDAAAYRDRIAELSDQLGLGFARFGNDLSTIDILMRNRRLAEAIAICREGLTKPAARIMHANYRQFMATAYSFAGDRDSAQREGQLALAGYEAAGAEDIASIVVAKLANDFAAPRDETAFERAAALLEPWVAKDLARGDAESACIKLDTLGRFSFQRYAFAAPNARNPENLDKAESFLARARALATALPPAKAARQLGNLAQTKAQIGHARNIEGEPEASFEEAIGHYERAGLEMEAANAKYIIGVSQLNRAADAFRAGQIQAAIAHTRSSEDNLAAALNYYSGSGMRAESANARLMQAQLRVNFSTMAADASLRESIRAEAVHLLGTAFQDLKDARSEYRVGDVLKDRTGKLHFSREAQRIAALAVEILLAAPQRWSEAWAWVQRAKAGALTELIDRPRDPPAALVAPLMNTPGCSDLVEEEARLWAASHNAPHDERKGLLDRRSEILRKLAETPAGKEYADFRSGQLFDIARVDRLFDSGGHHRPGICVDLVAGRRGLYMLTQRAGETPAVHRLNIDAADIDAFVADRLGPNLYRTTLTRDADLLMELEPILAPLAHVTRPGELIILCPTGSSHALPLHALPVGGGALIARNPVVYTWALGITNYTISRRNESLLPPRAIRLLGDSDGDRPAARRFVEELGGALQCQPAVGPDVTKSEITLALSTARFVHFQGHAIADPQNALRSHLKAADGELTAQMIMTLPEVHAELVALGACASGAAVIAAGDEPSGLVPSLLIAGARSALAALWPVSESSAAIFMRHFYASLLTGRVKADALREAALETMKQPGCEAPYHWAPYVLHGDWL